MSRSCKECAHYNPDFIDKVCWHCSWPEFAEEPLNFKAKPITNADRIRAMTDEELATIIFCGNPCVEKSFNTESELLEWLKQWAE